MGNSNHLDHFVFGTLLTGVVFGINIGVETSAQVAALNALVTIWSVALAWEYKGAIHGCKFDTTDILVTTLVANIMFVIFMLLM